MSAEKLAFLQNFYTDVTLYVPAEPATDPLVAAPLPAVAAVAAAPAVAIEAPATPADSPAAQPAQPAVVIEQPAATFERSAAPYNHSAEGSERAAAPFNQSAEDSGRSAGALGGPTTAAPALSAMPAKPAVPPAAAPVPVAAAPVAPAVSAVPPVMLTQFTTLGSNAEGVVLLFRLPHEQFLKLHRNVFLNKMLQALGFVLADVVLVNVDSDLPVALINLRRELAATRIIAFGRNLLDATLRNTQIYEPVLFPNLNLAFLASATVDLVEYDVSLKKRLWPGLQRMFLG